VLAAELPESEDVLGRPTSWQIFESDAGVYEALLQASMVLFSAKGYPETSMAEIASAVGIPVSGIYRYFPGKCDILSTGLRRAADRISGRLSAILTGLSEPRHMLNLLIEAYVATSFANPELVAIYYTERVNLTRVDEQLLRSVQRTTIDSWMRLLTSVRPELTSTQARIVVHAAMALVVDVGRLVHYEHPADNSAYPQACVRKLMEATVFGSAE
jgi:AcrR family transcriptional regulator